MYKSLYNMYSTFSTVTTDIYLENNTFINVSGQYGVVHIFDAGNISFINTTLVNSSDSFMHFFQVQRNFGNITIDGCHFENILSEPGSNYYYFRVSMPDGYFMSINDFTAKNVTLESEILFHLKGNVGFKMTNSSFESAKIGANSNLVSIDGVKTADISGVTMKDISSMHYENSAKYMIRINNLNLEGANNSTIEDIQVTDSSIGLLYLMSVRNTPPASKTLKIEDISFSNCEFLNSAHLLNLERVFTREDFAIRMSHVNFEDLSFANGGYLIFMNSQIEKGVYLVDSSATNITGSSLYIEASNKQDLTVKAKFILSNFTTDSINAQYSSFMLVYEGGELEIHDSDLKNIHCYEEGAVVFAGYQRAMVSIYSSSLHNNTALKGSVFYVDSQSVISVHDSLIFDNFAVEAGVIAATVDGYFEFFNTTITENYALSISVGEVLDVAEIPLISGSAIHGNMIMTKSQITQEMNTRCQKL